jgi:hypothetical protein
LVKKESSKGGDAFLFFAVKTLRVLKKGFFAMKEESADVREVYE